MISSILRPFGPAFDRHTACMTIGMSRIESPRVIFAWTIYWARNGFSSGRDATRLVTDPITDPAFGNSRQPNGLLCRSGIPHGVLGIPFEIGRHAMQHGRLHATAAGAQSIQITAVANKLVHCMGAAAYCAGGVLLGAGRASANMLQFAAGFSVAVPAALFGVYYGTVYWYEN